MTSKSPLPPTMGPMAKPPRLARAAGLIGAATMLSRILGLAREQLFAALLGATAMADAFNVAFRIPNLLRDLFAEGALAQAFVPTFKDKLRNRGKDEAFALANRVAGTIVIIIALIVLVAALVAPQIVGVMASEFAGVPGKYSLTVLLTRIMLPFLAIVSMAAVAMGMLNAQDRYTAPALAPAMFNVMSIGTGLVIWLGGVTGSWIAIGWSIGTLLGGLAQLGVQLPSLFRTGFRLRPALDLRLRDEGVRRVAWLMAPAVAGLAAVQVNIFVNTMFATTEPGAVSWLNYAFRFLQLPIGVFGVAIGTVSTTRYADAAADDDPQALSAHFTDGLRLVAFLTIPATVGLWLLGEPIIRLIFERGRFAPFDTDMTTVALKFFVIGLVFYAGVKVAAPAFYAVRRARIAVYASLLAVAGNLIINITLHPHFGFRILAFGTAVAAILNFTILYSSFARLVAPIKHLPLAFHVLRVVGASLTMGAVVFLVRGVVHDHLGTEGLWVRLLAVGAPIAAGVLIYAGACRLLGVEELEHFSAKLARRFRARG